MRVPVRRPRHGDGARRGGRDRHRWHGRPRLRRRERREPPADEHGEHLEPGRGRGAERHGGRLVRAHRRRPPVAGRTRSVQDLDGSDEGETLMHGLRQRWARRSLAALAVGALVAGACGGGDDGGSEDAGDGGAAGGGEPYVLGFSADLSGVFASLSQGALAGTQAYFDKLNAEGGIDGHPVELEVRDDRTDVQVGSADIRDLAEMGVPVILGNVSSVVWATTGNLAEELEVPQLAGAAVDGLVYPPRPYLYRYFQSAKQAAEGKLRYVLEQAESDQPRIASIRYESAGTDDWQKALEDAMGELDLELVANERFPAASTDVAPAASAVAAANPDYVVASLNDPHAPLVVDALRNRGYTGPIVSWVGSSEQVLAGVADPEFYVLRDSMAPELPEGAPVREAAEAAGVADNLNIFSTNGYLAAKFVADGLKICGFPCDGAGMEAAFQEVGAIDSEGLAGPGFGEVGDDSHILSSTVSIWHLAQGGPEGTIVGDWFEPTIEGLR
ncbi:MAG: ABC transporter substrate-binding protein [Acidimicrobiia bacterium]|nr:ABC transporter substrate-binding protein [Acidimicrobiia bacterium]